MVKKSLFLQIRIIPIDCCSVIDLGFYLNVGIGRYSKQLREQNITFPILILPPVVVAGLS